MENCAARVMAEAYIARHGLVWSRHSGLFRAPDDKPYWVSSSSLETHDGITSRDGSKILSGSGYTLSEAVDDYQKKTGLGYNS